MRIIAGSAGGRRLRTLKGMSTRPTADRVKEAVFSVLAPDIPGAKVLDAFAGSGALGLEALSRGAETAWFCEINPAAAQVCAANIKACAFSQANLRQGNLLNILPQLRETFPDLRFDLIFLDPPYRSKLLDGAFLTIEQGGWLADEGIIIAETAANTPPQTNSFFRMAKEKKYGDTAVRFYMLNPKMPNAEISQDSAR